MIKSMTLSEKHCVPCEGGTKPLSLMQAKELLKQVDGWAPGEDGKWIVKQFKFADFVEAVAFANKITPIAEREGHHPDLHISYGKVVVELSTHAIKGLSENDFILAAKIDAL
ncbi:MAG: 4a-hydroxytetrahydrobiopterin dehydratase [bacterium]|nr:4a-hydroxytetrahydrobiopterin dehydratase [bacterium]